MLWGMQKLIGPDGEVERVLSGNLELSRFARFERDYANILDNRIVIADQANLVVYANRPSDIVAAPISNVPGALLAGTTNRLTFGSNPDVPFTGSVAASALTSQGWRVIVEQPVATIHGQNAS